MAVEKITCVKCGRIKNSTDFFSFKDGTKDNMCKPCLTMHINNKDPQTFLWILEKFDVPYIEEVWVNLYNKIYTKNPAKFGPASVIGQYLRSMKMVQYKSLTYADTDRLAFEKEKEERDAASRRNSVQEDEHTEEYIAELERQLAAGEISQAQFDTLDPRNAEALFADDNTSKFINDNLFDEEAIRNQLSDEDFQYLSMKWGSLYKPSEWVRMEDLYNQYANEYDLNTDRKQTLIAICKNYLKMDQALDIGDVSAYKNLASVNDQLRKSAKFTEAQNKEEQTDLFSTIGELVALCEREGGIIEQFPDPIDYPQDKVDITIKDLQSYTYNLVSKELGLGDLIESYIQKLEEASKDDNEATTFILSAEDEEKHMMTDEDIESFQDFLEDEIEADAEALLALIEGENNVS